MFPTARLLTLLPSLQTIIMLLCTVAVPSHSADAGRQAWPALPEGLFSNFGRLVQGATLDFGAHAAHFLLNGLPPERLTTSKPAGGEGRSESPWTFSGLGYHPVRLLQEHTTARYFI